MTRFVEKVRLLIGYKQLYNRTHTHTPTHRKEFQKICTSCQIAHEEQIALCIVYTSFVLIFSIALVHGLPL